MDVWPGGGFVLYLKGPLQSDSDHQRSLQNAGDVGYRVLLPGSICLLRTDESKSAEVIASKYVDGTNEAKLTESERNLHRGRAPHQAHELS
jgi:hypothetical protein